MNLIANRAYNNHKVIQTSMIKLIISMIINYNLKITLQV
jgi:hypothetical protein